MSIENDIESMKNEIRKLEKATITLIGINEKLVEVLGRPEQTLYKSELGLLETELKTVDRLVRQ